VEVTAPLQLAHPPHVLRAHIVQTTPPLPPLALLAAIVLPAAIRQQLVHPPRIVWPAVGVPPLALRAHIAVVRILHLSFVQLVIIALSVQWHLKSALLVMCADTIPLICALFLALPLVVLKFFTTEYGGLYVMISLIPSLMQWSHVINWDSWVSQPPLLLLGVAWVQFGSTI